MSKQNSEARNPRENGLWLLVKFLPFAALLAWAYRPTFVWMWERWMARDSYFAHGVLIPLVTLYWIFKKRDAIVSEAGSAWIPGFLILLVAAGAHVISSMFRIYFLSAGAFTLYLIGLVSVLYGFRVFRSIWYPLLFLVLMIPLPLLMISETTLKMKFFVTEIATHLINASGLHAVREGSYIYTLHSFLLVGDPCSGLRSFLAFICLGFVFAYEAVMPLWKRVVLVICGLPLAIVSNVVRVYALGMLSEIYGTKAVEGRVHDASGVVVFIIAFTCFLALRRKLERGNPGAV